MFVDKKRKSRGKKNELYKEGATELVFLINDMLGQHRTIPALRLKHRSGGCGTVSALPKCSIMSGCGTRIVLRGQKPLALCDRCPCFGSLFPPLAALTFAASSIICAFGLASTAPRSPYRHLELCGIALIHPPLFPFSPLLFFFIHPFCFPAFHLSAHLLFQQTCNKKRAHQVGGGAEKALIGYFSNGQGQRKDTF